MTAMIGTESGDTVAPRVPPRSYLCALVDAGGTVPPELGVVRRLVNRGHRVTVLAGESLVDAVRATGADFLPRKGASPVVFRDWDLTPWDLARAMADHMMVGPAPSHAADTASAIDALAPDRVVVSALAVGPMIAAEARRVPFDLLIPNVYPFPVEGMPPFGGGLAPARGVAGRVRDQLVTAAAGGLFDRYALDGLNSLRANYGLEPVSVTWEQMARAHRQLILTSAAFDFPARLPDNACYVGPILDDPVWADGRTWKLPPGDDPLVLVAMSSTFQNHLECLQRVVDALGAMPLRALVTTGPAIRPEALSASPNVTVVESAPHERVLREAALVITHGGHGTVLKTLAAGLPLVILPHGRDQADNAVRVTTRGAGIAISRRASARKIANAVGRVLNHPSYGAAARRFGRVVARDADSPALLAELERG